MNNIIGQEKIKERIRIWVYTTPQNALFRGSAGSGKTTLALAYGKAIATDQLYYEICAGQKLYPPTDLEPVIIDEIHRLPNEENWYQYDGVLIGCTTEGAPVSEPLRSRMRELWLEPYSLEELSRIALLNAKIPDFAAECVANRCRGVPRLAVSLSKEVEAITKYYSYNLRTPDECNNILDSLGYFAGGFTENDKRYLELLSRRGPVSARVIAASLNLPQHTVIEEIEPFLLKRGLITITPKGRNICGKLLQ